MELHVTRAASWLDAAQHPIIEDEWLDLVATDASLEQDDDDPSTVWWHVDGEKIPIWFDDGVLVAKGADERVVAKLVMIAGALAARVLDEDDAEVV